MFRDNPINMKFSIKTLVGILEQKQKMDCRYDATDCESVALYAPPFPSVVLFIKLEQKDGNDLG